MRKWIILAVVLSGASVLMAQYSKDQNGNVIRTFDATELDGLKVERLAMIQSYRDEIVSYEAQKKELDERIKNRNELILQLQNELNSINTAAIADEVIVTP